MIKLVKLVTGEEVLAKVEFSHIGPNQSDVWTLHNPVKLALSPKGVAMVPLSPFMKENATITVGERDVIYTVDPDEDVVNAYNGQYGGIVMAPPGLRLT